MGISTLQSYHGAQIFEIIGLNQEVVDKYFTGAVSRIEGMGLDEIAREALAKHHLGFSRKTIPVDRLPVGGVYQWKRKGEGRSSSVKKGKKKSKKIPCHSRFINIHFHSQLQKNKNVCTLFGILRVNP